MTNNPILQNIFGTIGTILWSAQLLPQVYQNYKTKSTFGLSPFLMLIWAWSSIFLGVYNILRNINVALIIQPQSFGFLACLCWAQCLYYGDGPKPEPELGVDYYVDPKRKRREPMSFRKTCLIFVGILIFATAFEVGFVSILRATAKGDPPQLNQGGVQFFGITAAVLISLGLMPQYSEIYRLRRVVGISYIFMAVDALGGVFSLLSLAFKEKWDVTASISFALIVALDSLILILAVILNPIAKRRMNRARFGTGEQRENEELSESRTAAKKTRPNTDDDK